METPAVELIHVTAGYSGKPVQNDVSFKVKRSEIVVLLGGSGCGKSTMLKTIIGLLPAISGEILIGGDSIVKILSSFSLYATGIL